MQTALLVAVLSISPVINKQKNKRFPSSTLCLASACPLPRAASVLFFRRLRPPRARAFGLRPWNRVRRLRCPGPAAGAVDSARAPNFDPIRDSGFWKWKATTFSVPAVRSLQLDWRKFICLAGVAELLATVLTHEWGSVMSALSRAFGIDDLLL